MTTSAISELGKLPFEGASPAGNEVRGEPTFEQLEAELSKLSSPVHTASIDWNKITRLSAELLSTKGKDLMVACYLTGGLFETRSLAGMADGLQVIADMLETYWETMYPPLKRIRGRRNAVQWLVDRIQQRATEAAWTNLPPQELALVARLQGSLKTIDAVLMDKDSEAPSVRALLTLVKSLPTIAEEAPAPTRQAAPVSVKPSAQEAPAPTRQAAPVSVKPSAQEAPAPTRQAAPVSVKPSAEDTPTLVLDSGEKAEQALGEVCSRLEPIAQWLLNEDLANPLPYRLNRLAAWTALNVLPPVVSGRTPVRGPVSHLVNALEKLKSSQTDEALVYFAETQLAAFPFWLDLNFVCAAALERMGRRFDAARHEVCGETARLVGRLKGIEKLVFAAGVPFADGETIAWLASLATAQNSSSEPGVPRDPGVIAIAIGNARTLAASHDLSGAVDCLQQQLALNNAPKDDLLLRIRLCELLLTERPGAALEAFALSLVDRIDRHQLADWEPALALDGLQVAYKIMTRHEDNKIAANRLLERVLSLDAVAAVKLVI
jgi:type VI secretion system protein VasJ